MTGVYSKQLERLPYQEVRSIRVKWRIVYHFLKQCCTATKATYKPLFFTIRDEIRLDIV